jgi:hypothetical protein
MNSTEYDYGEIREPPGKPEQEVLMDSHVFIIAWDSAGKRYVFGTTPQMLKERADAERFKICDLSRYPFGSPTGFVNKVVVIQTYEKGTIPYRTSADDALRKYDSREDFRVLREL